jgi:hypothetical protein
MTSRARGNNPLLTPEQPIRAKKMRGEVSSGGGLGEPLGFHGLDERGPHHEWAPSCVKPSLSSACRPQIASPFTAFANHELPELTPKRFLVGSPGNGVGASPSAPDFEFARLQTRCGLEQGGEGLRLCDQLGKRAGVRGLRRDRRPEITWFRGPGMAVCQAPLLPRDRGLQHPADGVEA